MTKLLKELHHLPVADLLENASFRTWARRADAVVPGELKNVAEARAILLGIDLDTPGLEPPTAKEKAADFAVLLTRITPEADDVPDLTSPAASVRQTKVRRLRPVWPAIAAAVLLLIAAGSFLLRPAADTLYATGNAEQLSVELPDGTAVTLNANSTLLLDGPTWAKEERTVELTGEAYFNVTKSAGPNGARPFLVRTGASVVRVLGTRFNVRERRGGTRVFLEEGKVVVGWPGTDLPEMELAPGEAINRKSHDEAAVRIPVSRPSRHLAWRGGHVSFDGRPLKEALSELGDIYGLTFRYADPLLAKEKITSNGVPLDNLPVAVSLLERALGLRIEAREDSVYVVSGAE